MNPKKFSTILHSQFNYHTLPVTPFNIFIFGELSLKIYVNVRLGNVMNRKVKMQIIGKGKYGLEINGKLKKRKRKCLEITKRRKSMGYRREKLKKCKG